MKQKWYFLLATSALLLTACSSNDLAENPEKPVTQEDDAAVNFGAYVNRGVTRAGATGELTTNGTGNQTTPAVSLMDGFGVFSYYSDGEPYSETSKPNFMYNQKVTGAGAGTADDPVVWSYTPLKYWPNEFGKKAASEGQDFLTFFAYAPYVNVIPSTGRVDKTQYAGDEDALTSGIVGLTSNTASGDPYVKYYADMDPDNRVDLCWAVAKENFNASIDDESVNAIAAGDPYIDVLKPTTNAKINFDFKHALAALNIQIDADFDAESGTVHDPANNNVPKDRAPETRIWVRSVTFEGFTDKGRLNLNANAQDGPLWFDLTVADSPIGSGTVTIFDGRTDGKEGRDNAIAKKETPATLNAGIIQTAPYDQTQLANNILTISDAVPGVTNKTVNLFDANGIADEAGDNDETKAAKAAARLNMPIYVIPTDENLKITIVYDVETYDPNLAQFLSDGAVKGSSIQNTIEKEITIGGQTFSLEAGKIYTIGLHLGMTSVKFDASVTDWTDDATNVDLPYNTDNNQPGPAPAPAEYFTAAEAAAYNLTLPGAWQYGDIKTPVTYYTDEEIAAHNAARDVWVAPKLKTAAHGAIYSFTSYNTNEPATIYGNGTVEVMGQADGKTTVKVLTNPDHPEFVNQQFVVHATELGAGDLELFTVDGDAPTGISVTNVVLVEAAVADDIYYTDEEIAAHNALPEQEEWVAPKVKTEAVPYTNEEVDEHNAGLDGAAHEGDAKDADGKPIPAGGGGGQQGGGGGNDPAPAPSPLFWSVSPANHYTPILAPRRR